MKCPLTEKKLKIFKKHRKYPKKLITLELFIGKNYTCTLNVKFICIHNIGGERLREKLGGDHGKKDHSASFSRRP